VSEPFACECFSSDIIFIPSAPILSRLHPYHPVCSYPIPSASNPIPVAEEAGKKFCLLNFPSFSLFFLSPDKAYGILQSIVIFPDCFPFTSFFFFFFLLFFFFFFLLLLFFFLLLLLFFFFSFLSLPFLFFFLLIPLFSSSSFSSSSSLYTYTKQG
jgi:hypothetical protein